MALPGAGVRSHDWQDDDAGRGVGPDAGSHGWDAEGMLM